mmetsp:Transcript_21046/g.19175  ORF Transcript_21046/g.19175 Transcript_21046/m.19175 type:complete len:461 (+) Transcript_21046:1-1383(+)
MIDIIYKLYIGFIVILVLLIPILYFINKNIMFYQIEIINRIISLFISNQNDRKNSSSKGEAKQLQPKLMDTPKTKFTLKDTYKGIPSYVEYLYINSVSLIIKPKYSEECEVFGKKDKIDICLKKLIEFAMILCETNSGNRCELSIDYKKSDNKVNCSYTINCNCPGFNNCTTLQDLYNDIHSINDTDNDSHISKSDLNSYVSKSDNNSIENSSQIDSINDGLSFDFSSLGNSSFYTKSSVSKDMNSTIEYIYELIDNINGKLEITTDISKCFTITLNSDIDTPNHSIQKDTINIEILTNNDDIILKPIKHSKCNKQLKYKIDKSVIANNVTVLVVEDDKSNRKLLYKTLTKLGFKVILSYDGQHMLDLLDNNSYLYDQVDLILIDNHMPRLTGSEAVAILRNDRVYDGLILGITGCIIKCDLDEFKNAGCNDIIMKPFDTDVFISLLIKYGVVRSISPGQ